MSRTEIIAEIGTSHDGDPAKADELIAAAHEAGADIAKFQYVIADEIVHPAMTPIDLPGGSTPLHQRFRELERPQEFYASLAESCARHGIEFLCTAFGVGSARALHEIGLQRFKVASPEINHLELLALLAELGVDLIISTGVSRLTDIERALSIAATERSQLLHCITSYPAPEEEYNLGLIRTLAGVFGVPVGLSDHSLDPILVPGLAVCLGARTVEKHFTLSRSDAGLDDPIALEPDQFARMVQTIRTAESDPAAMEQSLRREYGDTRVDAVLGDGVKRLAQAESSNYRTTRRSLLAVRDLDAGEVLTTSSVAALRSESLPPGLEPQHLDDLVGATLSRPVRSGHGITWQDICSVTNRGVLKPSDPSSRTERS